MKTELNITLIARGCAITGDMVVDHGISCFGLLDGGIISTQGLLHIGEGGLVKGSAQGEHVRIDGRVDGDVHARGRWKSTAKSRATSSTPARSALVRVRL